jgi:hypothetical protein
MGSNIHSGRYKALNYSVVSGRYKALNYSVVSGKYKALNYSVVSGRFKALNYSVVSTLKMFLFLYYRHRETHGAPLDDFLCHFMQC